MNAALLAIIQAIAYAVAKGCTEAYLDAIKERSTAEDETTNASDLANRDRFANAVDKLRSSSGRNSELDNSTQTR